MSERIKLLVGKCPGCGVSLDFGKVTASQAKRELWQLPITSDGELDRDNPDGVDPDWPESQDDKPEVVCSAGRAPIPVEFQDAEPCEQTRLGS